MNLVSEDFDVPWWHDYCEGDMLDRLRLIEKSVFVIDLLEMRGNKKVSDKEFKEFVVSFLNSYFDDCLAYSYQKKIYENHFRFKRDNP